MPELNAQNVDLRLSEPSVPLAGHPVDVHGTVSCILDSVSEKKYLVDILSSAKSPKGQPLHSNLSGPLMLASLDKIAVLLVSLGATVGPVRTALEEIALIEGGQNAFRAIAEIHKACIGSVEKAILAIAAVKRVLVGHDGPKVCFNLYDANGMYGDDLDLFLRCAAFTESYPNGAIQLIYASKNGSFSKERTEAVLLNGADAREEALRELVASKDAPASQNPDVLHLLSLKPGVAIKKSSKASKILARSEDFNPDETELLIRQAKNPFVRALVAASLYPDDILLEEFAKTEKHPAACAMVLSENEDLVNQLQECRRHFADELASFAANKLPPCKPEELDQADRAEVFASLHYLTQRVLNIGELLERSAAASK